MNDLNFRLALEELAFIANDSNIKVLFVDDSFLELGRSMLERCEDLFALVHMTPDEPADGTTAYESLTAAAPQPIVDI